MYCANSSTLTLDATAALKILAPSVWTLILYFSAKVFISDKVETGYTLPVPTEFYKQINDVFGFVIDFSFRI